MITLFEPTVAMVVTVAMVDKVKMVDEAAKAVHQVVVAMVADSSQPTVMPDKVVLVAVAAKQELVDAVVTVAKVALVVPLNFKIQISLITPVAS